MLAADVVNRALGSVMFWTGIAVGVPTGIAFVVMRRAWSDHNKVKQTLPSLRKAAWASVSRFLKFAVIVAVLVIVSVAWLAGYKGRNPIPIPASVPTAPPSTVTSPRR